MSTVKCRGAVSAALQTAPSLHASFDLEIAGRQRVCSATMASLRRCRYDPEMFDPLARAFNILGGVPPRGIYNNLKLVVDVICVGRERCYHQQFLVMCKHYLVIIPLRRSLWP